MMNKLAYGILSLLASKEHSGYELTQRLKLFWHTNHSAIYPLLANLETRGHVTCTLYQQEGKPDKKIYAVTPKGKEKLNEWVICDLDRAIKKDELTLRLFCMEALDRESLLTLLAKIRKRCDEKIERMHKALAELEEISDNTIDSPSSHRIGSYFLIQKAILEAQNEKRWSRFIQQFVESEKPLDLFALDFDKIVQQM